ncbi:unnamed protein product [Camellia sinensis]|uniref:RING-type E3 ubiquitin transferase n=1 Tax=Camellia sinensis var. sinensis TaxID=542762 RepID=A0A4S4E144_CAMSN|nr:RING-H2 finger protein ATL39-like [Camellia sinensis]THG09084.1 hypothetical protein TEA_016788 [Camellia sinensis var. sinensis]
MSSDNHGTKISDGTIEAMFGVIFVFIGAVVLFTMIRIYSMYCLKNQQRRRRTTINGVAPPPTDLHSAEQPRTGLDQSTIDLIPKFVYKANHHRLSQGEDDRECSVCLSNIIEEAIVRLLPNCKHLFHEDCIDVWLRSHMTCPVCRAMVDPGAQAENDELRVATEPTAQAENDELRVAMEPTAPPPEESTADGLGGSILALSSFRRMLSRERSSTSFHSCGEAVGAEDIERH